MADAGLGPNSKSGVSKHRKKDDSTKASVMGASSLTQRHRCLVCASCRRRKSKCDGGHPRCSTCIAYKDQCHYDKPPSLAYVRSLEEQVEELKKKLAESQSSWPHGETSPDGVKPPPSLVAQTSSMSIGSQSDSGHPHGKAHYKETDLSIDADGTISYHNATSAVYDPPAESPSASTYAEHQIDGSPMLVRQGSLTSPQYSLDEARKEELMQNAAQSRAWEQRVVQNTSLKTDVPASVASELLKLHFTWISPMFLFVYRTAFIRGMSIAQQSRTPTPYFSSTLLQVVYAHTARFLNHPVEQPRRLYQASDIPRSELGDTIMLPPKIFMKRLNEEASLSVGMETMNPSSVPTVQAFLQQSARAIAFGLSSQAWLYSGMAFRMAIDLGVHLPTEKFQSYVKILSAEDIEVRKRLFWSCWTFDKVVSLYMGRMPMFTPAADVPLTFEDDYGENDLWSPYYGEAPHTEKHVAQYPPTPGHVLSCFTALCKLSLILNTLLLEIYSSATPPNVELESAFNRISLSLKMFWTSLPEYLRVQPDRIPALSPPPHIVSMNLLYHTMLILLHRPYVLGVKDFEDPLVQRSLDICKTATKAIHDLLELMSNTFGFAHITYLNTYSCYIAATIAMLRFENDSNVNGTADITSEQFGLKFLLEVLQKTAARMPALERSVDILKRKLKTILDRQNGKKMASLFTNPQAPAMNIPYGSGVQPVTAAYQNGTLFAAPNGNPMVDQPFLEGDASSTQVLMFAPGPNPQPFPNMTYNDDLLPAFPGQQFPIGSEHGLGPEMIDAETRRELMSTNLNPHLSLDHSRGDWVYTDYFTSQGAM